MRKMILTLSFLLVGSLVSQGQPSQDAFPSNSSTTSSSTASSGFAGSEVFHGGIGGPDYRSGKGPLGSVSENFIYMYAPGEYGANRSLMGWSVVPSLTPVHGLGLQADFESLYMRTVYPGQSWLSMTAGPRFNMAPRARFTPFIFAEAGEMRLESQYKRNVDWEPVAKGGFGFESRLSNNFGITLVPGEWTGIRYDYNGSWNQNFTARVGITFYLGRNKMPES
jgi:hypothetical protein